MPKAIRLILVLAFRFAGLFACMSPAAACAAPPAEIAKGPVTILDGSGTWRVLHAWNAPLVQTFAGLQERRNRSSRSEPVERPGFRFLTAAPAAGWTTTAFDDTAWPRRHFFAKYSNGESDERAGGGSASPYLRLLCLRGKFTVSDTATVGPLWLTLAYRGGLIVHVNGREIGRGHMPPGKSESGAPAEIYPRQVYLKDNGKPWHWYQDQDLIRKEVYPLRVRRLEKLPIPADLLQKGTNVLAVEIHAAPYPEAFQKAIPDWSTCGLVELHLKAEHTRGLVPNVVRPTGVQVWNTSTAEQVFDTCWGDPHEPLKPLSLAGPRNGVCSARVVVSSDRPLKNVRATLDGLRGLDHAAIPETAVKVWYGRFDAAREARWGGASDRGAMQWGSLARRRDDALLGSPPEEVPLSKKEMPRGAPEDRLADGLPPTLVDGALVPVWLLVEIPKDATAGQYRGTLTITADGRQVAKTPVGLRVIDWTLPDPAEYAYWMGMIQSPEAVALTYGVPLWSEKHCRLVGKSLEWIGKLGGKVLVSPAGRGEPVRKRRIDGFVGPRRRRQVHP